MLCEALTDFLDEGVILMFAVQKRRREGIKFPLFRHFNGGFQAAMVTMSAPFMLTIDHASKESLKIIFIPVDHLQSGSFGVGLDGLLSPHIFLIGVDVGIVKKPEGLKPRFPQPLQGKNGTMCTTRMKQNLHGTSLLFFRGRDG